jgi:hypothetical protein
METHHNNSTNTDHGASGSKKTSSLGDIFKAEFTLPDIIAKMCLFQADADLAQQQSSASMFLDTKSDAGNSTASDIAWLSESELDRVCLFQNFSFPCL